jgi:hypothetical protein
VSLFVAFVFIIARSFDQIHVICGCCWNHFHRFSISSSIPFCSVLFPQWNVFLLKIEQENGVSITGSVLNDIRLISCIAVFAMLAIALIGTEWESKVGLFKNNFV